MSNSDLYTIDALRRQLVTVRGALKLAIAEHGSNCQESRDLRYTIARMEDEIAAASPAKKPRDERDAVEERARKRYFGQRV